MKISAGKNMPRFALWAAYFLLLIFTALPHGMRTVLTPHYGCHGVCATSACKPEALTASATNADIIRVMGQNDAAFIAKRVRLIAETSDWGHISLWPLWPPGMVVIQTALYTISPAIPVGLCMLLLSAMLWAGVCTQLEVFAGSAIANRYIRFLFPLMLLVPALSTYMFQLGVFYSEPLSIAAFLLGVGILVLAVQLCSLYRAIAAGLWFALSAYIRAQTDMVMSLCLLSALLIAVIIMLLHVRKHPRFSVKACFAHASWLGMIAVAFLSYQAATFPYRAAHEMHWIAFTENPLWHAVWQKRDFITPDLQFYADGGALAGCTVDPERCEMIHQLQPNGHEVSYTTADYFRFTVLSFLRHPLRWLAFKSGYLRAFWLDGTPLALMATLLLPFLVVQYWRHPDNVSRMLAFFMLTTGVAILGPFLLMHIEERYMYQFKFLILYAGGVTFARHFKLTRAPIPAT